MDAAAPNGLLLLITINLNDFLNLSLRSVGRDVLSKRHTPHARCMLLSFASAITSAGSGCAVALHGHGRRIGRIDRNATDRM